MVNNGPKFSNSSIYIEQILAIVHQVQIMAKTSEHLSFFTIFLVFSLVPTTFSNTLSDDNSDRPMTFIVHMAKSHKPFLFTSHRHWYTSIIESLPSNSRYPSKLIYTYEKVANGFAASLTPSQVEKLKTIPGVLSVMPDKAQKLHITHTYKFLGLSHSSGLWPSSNYGEDIIIGVLDTGIWPENPSFSDEGLGPVPETWKGICETASDFPVTSCNRKLIGARTFIEGYYSSHLGRSPLNVSEVTNSTRDTNGHGTHTASTAAGAVVSNASFLGYAQGVAIGAAPKARIAAYKVCATSTSCFYSDMAAAMDQAVTDGVHIISISIGGGTFEYYQDAVAIATFGATRHGVLVSVSAGNEGPDPSTVNHLPPWVLTVGASTVNREFRADVVLGDGRTFIGSSLFVGTPLPSSNRYPIVYAGDFDNNFCSISKNFSNEYQLVGKIIVCDGGYTSSSEMAIAVSSVDGTGFIAVNKKDYGEQLLADLHPIPATQVGHNEGEEIKEYIKSSQNPTANILFYGTVIGPSPPAPQVAAFSSRGPNPLTQQILKPDVIAPGVNILGAWPQSIITWEGIIGIFEYYIISGTSMACPHVSGIAALLRKVYPKWSPTAIKSALITTAYNSDNSKQNIKDLSTGKESTPFAHGAGHVDPNRALDPGLVYDMGVIDYVGFLCSIGYDSELISIFLGKVVSTDICNRTYDKLGARVTPGDLNLPSFSVVFNDGAETVKYRRSVTNVGRNSDAAYVVNVSAPVGTQISVSPSKLVFSANNSTQTYEITFSSIGGYSEASKFGWIEWTDGTHRVRSPVAFSWESSPTTSSMAFI